MTASASLGVEITDRDAWLEERRRGVGASEAAAILGLHPHLTTLELYAEKIGARRRPEKPTKAQLRGLLLEPYVAEDYAEMTGRTIVRSQVFVRSDLRPHVSATLDAVCDDGTVVELKTVTGWKARDFGGEWSDELPDHFLIQAQVQCYCAGVDAVDFAVLIGDAERPNLYRVPRRDDQIELILDRVDGFWARVERRMPPPAADPRDAWIVPLLYPRPDGSVCLGSEAAAIADRLEAARAAASAASKEADLAKAELIGLLAEAREAVLPDGRRVRRYDHVHPERTQTIRAHTATTLKVLKAKGGRA